MLIYRLLLTLVWPILAGALAWRALRGREDWETWRERLGLTLPEHSDMPGLWLHAASNGELASARAFLGMLRDHRPEMRVFITCNSVTGRDMARALGYDAACAPLDTVWSARALAARRNIQALVTMEAEFWPNRHSELARRGAPVVLLGARLSEGTAEGWARFAALARKMLAPVRLAVPQDLSTGPRLERLGLDPDRITAPIDLKALTPDTTLTPSADLRAAFRRSSTWLAASTHPGEEDIVLEAHKQARRVLPNLRLILVPRHAPRGKEVARLCEEAGFACQQRSVTEETPRADNVYIADTMREMDLWYALSSVAFVGGSLADHGGHTPFEPAAHGCAILFGPHTRNFAAPYNRLAALDQPGLVQASDDLAQSVISLIQGETWQSCGKTSAAALFENDQSEELMRVIDALPGRGPHIKPTP